MTNKASVAGHMLKEINKAVALMALLLLAMPALVRAQNAKADVRAVRFSGNAEQARIVIETRQKLDYRWFTLAQNGLRLVVDMPVVHWQLGDSGHSVLTGKGKGFGIIKGYRFGQNSPATSRVVFDLDQAMAVKKDFYLPPINDGAPYRLVIDLQKTDPIAFITEAGFKDPFSPRPTGQVAIAPEPGQTAAVPSRKKRQHLHLARKIIVIDPGHGGKDPGAIGKRQHLREKSVNLRAAKLLKKQLERSGRYSVRLTRSTDVFIPLVGRVKYARSQQADLLISLHSDSAANIKARGASVYTRVEWASRRTKKEIMRGDRSIIGVDIASARPGVDDILLNLSQRQTQNESAIFAEILTARLARVGPMLSNSHRDKNLFVLLAPDVPAVLVEMGFLSNRYDEANLGSARYLRKLMGAVSNSVDAYFRQTARLHAAR